MGLLPPSLLQMARPETVRAARESRRQYGLWRASLDAAVARLFSSLRRHLQQLGKSMVEGLTPEMLKAAEILGWRWVIDHLSRDSLWLQDFKTSLYAGLERSWWLESAAQTRDLQRRVDSHPLPRYGWWNSGNGRLLRDADGNVLLWGWGHESDPDAVGWSGSYLDAVTNGWERADTRTQMGLMDGDVEDLKILGRPLRPALWSVRLQPSEFWGFVEASGRGSYNYAGTGERQLDHWRAWWDLVVPLLVMTDFLSVQVPNAQDFDRRFADGAGAVDAAWQEAGFEDALRERVTGIVEDAEDVEDAKERVAAALVAGDSSIYKLLVGVAAVQASGVLSGALLDTWSGSGVVNGKTWLCSLIPTSRAWHVVAHQQTVPLNQKFELNGPSGPRYMDGPGDPAGGAENLCNCLCGMTAVLQGEAS